MTTYACPECGTEMYESSIEPGFLCHLESTDCAPEPWPYIGGENVVEWVDSPLENV